jgi:TatD DNase family protein
MELKYFDAHCHVQFDSFGADQADILARMKEQGIGGLVVGVDAASSRAACDLSELHDNLWASVGLHPNDNPDEVFDEHEFRNLLMYPKAVAIGECGLDYFRPTDTSEEAKKKQRERFARHITLAGQTKRPLIVHARPSKGSMDAYEDALELLEIAKREYGDNLKGDFHFFVGDVEIARRVFELDFMVSYTAVVTFARDYDEAIRCAPQTHLMTETDAPFVAPLSRRGQRNDPLSIPEIVAKLAEIRGEDPEALRAATVANAQRLFKLA